MTTDEFLRMFNFKSLSEAAAYATKACKDTQTTNLRDAARVLSERKKALTVQAGALILDIEADARAVLLSDVERLSPGMGRAAGVMPTVHLREYVADLQRASKYAGWGCAR